MRNTTTATIPPREPIVQFPEGRVSNSGSGRPSESFGSLAHEAQKREEETRLESRLVEGMTTGDEILVTPDFWADLRAEAAQRLSPG
jgi:hypothetical protein